jgi:hypothetical protein
MSMRIVMNSLFGKMAQWVAMMRCMLREIFDEAAYLRFLQRQGIVSSRDAYADFLRETEANRERRPRCC